MIYRNEEPCLTNGTQLLIAESILPYMREISSYFEEIPFAYYGYVVIMLRSYEYRKAVESLQDALSYSQTS